MVELDHLLDDLVLLTTKVSTVFKFTRLIGALVNDPLLFLDGDFTLLLTRVVADYPFGRVVVAITYIVSALWNPHRSLLAIDEKRFASRSHTVLNNFSVESTVISLRVGPLLVLELKSVIEEILAFNELATVPLGNIASLKTKNRLN